MKYLSILLLFSLSVNALADEAVYLNKSDPAPFAGYLLTPDKATKVYNLNLELQSEQKINSLMMQEQDVYAKRLTNAQTENDQLSKQLVSQQDKSFVSKVGYFVLGAVLTGLISYGAMRTLK